MSQNTAKQRYEQLTEWMKSNETVSKAAQKRKRFSKARAYKKTR